MPNKLNHGLSGAAVQAIWNYTQVGYMSKNRDRFPINVATDECKKALKGTRLDEDKKILDKQFGILMLYNPEDK